MLRPWEGSYVSDKEYVCNIICRKKNGDYVYGIKHRDGRRFELTRGVFAELLTADGLHELKLKPKLCYKLQDEGLLTAGRFEYHGLVNNWIVMMIGKRAKRLKKLAGLVNFVLPWLALITMGAGLFFLKGHKPLYTGKFYHILTIYLVLLASLFMHQIGHLMAAIASDRPVEHIGCFLLGIIPVGFYIHYGDDDQALVMRLAGLKKKERTLRTNAQLAFSGCEMNFLLAGICLVVQHFFSSVPELVQFAIVFNIFLAIINLLPCLSFDGAEFLSSVFGIEHLDTYTMKTLFKKKEDSIFIRNQVATVYSSPLS